MIEKKLDLRLVAEGHFSFFPPKNENEILFEFSAKARKR
jgi:hypothetical protein